MIFGWIKSKKERTAELQAALDRAREAWLSEMGDFVAAPGVVQLPPSPALGERHVGRCQVVPARERIIQKMPAGGVAVEVGVQTGKFSRRILDLARPATLHLVDLDLQTHAVAEKFRDEIREGRVVLHEADSAETLAALADGSCDFIYLDADHSYDGVKRDIEAAKSKVKTDGFLIFNDYTYWSPCECLAYGVVQAVNELCIREDWEIAYFSFEPYLYCDVALRRLRPD